MPTVELTVNGKRRSFAGDPETPLLWVLRDHLGLTGTKFGCGVGVCGACTVLWQGLAVRSCQIPIRDAAGKSFTTIEGLSADGSHPCQRAWIEEDVAQCGYCQPGMILSAAALIGAKPQPTDTEIEDVMSGLVCRCGTYPRIRKAVRLAARLARASR
ncbi:MAG TPA: (2Fe-2S)-binding protein [Thermoanaerobaculia bacterium]|nr:(2Fe-2S)-binding protein [Thermoanaerobaculia bacterium]